MGERFIDKVNRWTKNPKTNRGWFGHNPIDLTQLKDDPRVEMGGDGNTLKGGALAAEIPNVARMQQNRIQQEGAERAQRQAESNY